MALLGCGGDGEGGGGGGGVSGVAVARLARAAALARARPAAASGAEGAEGSSRKRSWRRVHVPSQAGSARSCDPWRPPAVATAPACFLTNDLSAGARGRVRALVVSDAGRRRAQGPERAGGRPRRCACGERAACRRIRRRARPAAAGRPQGVLGARASVETVLLAGSAGMAAREGRANVRRRHARGRARMLGARAIAAKCAGPSC